MNKNQTLELLAKILKERETARKHIDDLTKDTKQTLDDGIFLRLKWLTRNYEKKR